MPLRRTTQRLDSPLFPLWSHCVQGGWEISFGQTAGPKVQAMESYFASSLGAPPTPLGADFSRTFKLGLTKATLTGTDFLNINSGGQTVFSLKTTVERQFPLTDFLTYFNFATGNTTLTWCVLAPDMLCVGLLR